VTLNNLERRNGHFQVIIAKLTMDETGRATWRKIRNRINTLCIICVVINSMYYLCCHYYISCDE